MHSVHFVNVYSVKQIAQKPHGLGSDFKGTIVHALLSLFHSSAAKLFGPLHGGGILNAPTEPLRLLSQVEWILLKLYFLKYCRLASSYYIILEHFAKL